jgi:hypothetical protein
MRHVSAQPDTPNIMMYSNVGLRTIVLKLNHNQLDLARWPRHNIWTLGDCFCKDIFCTSLTARSIFLLCGLLNDAFGN